MSSKKQEQVARCLAETKWSVTTLVHKYTEFISWKCSEISGGVGVGVTFARSVSAYHGSKSKSEQNANCL